MKLSMQILEEIAVNAKKKKKDVFIEVVGPTIKNKVYMYHSNQLDKMLKFVKDNFDNDLKNKVDPRIKIDGIRVW